MYAYVVAAVSSDSGVMFVWMTDRSFLSAIHHISKFRAKKLRNDPCLRTFLESSNDKSILLMLSHIQEYAFLFKEKKETTQFVKTIHENYTQKIICHWNQKMLIFEII